MMSDDQSNWRFFDFFRMAAAAILEF